MPYIPHTAAEVERMLASIGVSSVEELFEAVPASLRASYLRLPAGLSESEVLARLTALSQSNNVAMTTYLGGGVYGHAIPAAVDALASRSEFYTAYTPYQAEASQGTLQAIFEYQTAMARLFDMEAANASVYDGGTALFEAAMMAKRQTGRNTLLVSQSVNPVYRRMLATHASRLKVTVREVAHDSGLAGVAALEDILSKDGSDIACVIVALPNFFGFIEDFSSLAATAKAAGALMVVSANPVMASVVKTPGAMGADIVAAEGQPLGLPLSFGGPYLGVLACTKALLRQLPGRLVGRAQDSLGRPGFVLTLQAREQHIRRQKATSNICSNQALCALRALITVCLWGPEGMRRTALGSMANAHYAAGKLTEIEGITLLSDAPYGNEFAVRLRDNATEITKNLMNWRFIPGIPLGRYYPELADTLLVACTEQHDREHMDGMVAMVEALR